jgi:hypothetical protein
MHAVCHSGRLDQSRQKSLNLFGASAVYTAVLVIDRWPSQRKPCPDREISARGPLGLIGGGASVESVALSR